MKNWYDIKNQADKVLIYFYGDICMDEWGKWTNDDKCPSDIVEALAAAGGKPLIVRINSGGGSVFGGQAIYNVLKTYQGKKTVYVDGVAASIASLIMLCGDEINIPENATVMLHEPWSWGWGTAKEMEAVAASLRVCWDTILAVYSDHLNDGQTIEDLRAQIEARGEYWMDGKKAAEIFRLNGTPAVKAAACMGGMLDRWQKTPEGIPRARAEPEGKDGGTPPSPQGEGFGLEGALELASAFCFVENERSH